MDHRRVIAVAYQLTDTACRHLRILLSQVHRHLTNLHQITLAALTGNLTLLDIVMTAHLLKDLINGERMVVDLHGSFDDALSQTHVHIGVVDNGISHQRVDDSLKIADAAVGRLCNILDDISRNLQTVTTALRMEDINTQLHIRLLQFGYQTTGETGQQAILHALEIHWRTVAGQNDLASHAEKMIENMEERVECLGRIHPLLDIIYDQHIDALVEVDEVVGRVMTHRVGKLHLEQAGRDVKDAFLGIGLLAAHTDSIHKMGLATARGAIDKERIKGGLSRMFSNGEADGTRQFVGITLDEVLEGLLRIKLGIQLLRCGSIERRRSLVATLWLLDLRRTLTLDRGRHIVLGLDRDNTVVQLHARTKDAGKNLA